MFDISVHWLQWLWTPSDWIASKHLLTFLTVRSIFSIVFAFVIQFRSKPLTKSRWGSHRGTIWTSYHYPAITIGLYYRLFSILVEAIFSTTLLDSVNDCDLRLDRLNRSIHPIEFRGNGVWHIDLVDSILIIRPDWRHVISASWVKYLTEVKPIVNTFSDISLTLTLSSDGVPQTVSTIVEVRIDPQTWSN